MSKRFTSTEKWADIWFQELSPTAKLLWFWLLDNCDNSGVIRMNLKLASFQIGEAVEEKHLLELGDRLQPISDGKHWIGKFVKFQFGKLNPECRPHASVIALLEFHGLDGRTNERVSQVYPKGKDTLKDKDKDKYKDKKGGTGGKFSEPTLEMVLLNAAKIGLPDSEGDRFFNYYKSNGWRVGKNPMKSWQSAMVNWRGNWQEKNGGRKTGAREMTDAEILREAMQ